MADYQRPKEVARRLGVSPSGLRRLATIYCAIYGEMPRDEGRNRLWPSEAVARLEAARSLVAAGRTRTIKEALAALEQGAEVPPSASPELDASVRLAAVVTEALVPLLARLEAQARELQALRDDVRALSEMLERQT